MTRYINRSRPRGTKKVRGWKAKRAKVCRPIPMTFTHTLEDWIGNRILSGPTESTVTVWMPK